MLNFSSQTHFKLLNELVYNNITESLTKEPYNNYVF